MLEKERMASHRKIMNLLVVLPISQGDAALAEKLLDWCYELNDNEPVKAHCLIYCAHDVHGEMQTKAKIAAEVAFESSELVMAKPLTQNNKIELCNNLFSQ